MAQTTMYAGFVNSPEAKLTAGINSSATTIPVDYLEYFPAAPNVATLGKGQNAETIYYGAKSAASGAGNLTGVTRGWNKTGSVGAAIAWPINTVIARRPTEYDHATFKANIEDLAGLNLALYKGAIDCAANPNYPAGNASEFWIVSVAGKIGGTSGIVVTAGDTIICNTDGTASGDQATVGAYWNVLQTNIDLTNITITGGAISGCNVTVGAGKTLDVSAGTLTLADNQISGDKVEGGTIAATTITTLSTTYVGIGVAGGTYPLLVKNQSECNAPTLSAEFLDADNWTSADWTGSWAGGWAHTIGNTTVLSHDHAASSGTYYYITYTVTGTAGAGFTITFGGQTSAAKTATGSWSCKATGTGGLQITPATDFAGTIVISIKSISAASTAAVRHTDSAGTLRSETRITNTTDDTYIGIAAGGYSVPATNNVCLGNYALQYAITGGSNVAIGAYALNGLVSGTDNVGLGFYTIPYNQAGCRNIAIGSAVMTSGSASGSDNIGIGSNSLNLSTSGYQNIGIGVLAGRTLTTGYTNAFLGYYAGNNANQKADAVNSMGLGANTFTNRSNQIVIGDANVVETQLRTGVYIGSTSTTAHTAPTARLHIAAGSASASTAPIKLTSGTVMTNPEAGAIEFLTDDFYATITTGAARKCFILDNGSRLTSGKIPIATTNGRLIDGQTPLAGTKVYYVSNSSGGTVNRKLTFVNGVLTAET